MVTVEETRLVNLRELIARAKGPSNLARVVEMSVSLLSQMAGRNPSKPIGQRAARKIEEAFGLQRGWLDVPHERGVQASNINIHVNGSAGVFMIQESQLIFAGSSSEAPGYGLVRESEAAPYSADWFAEMGIEPEKAVRFRVSGDSMEPLLHAGDVVLVNTEETTVVDGAVYAVSYGEELRVKRLSRRLDGSLVLSSDNRHYEPDRVSGRNIKKVRVIGRVREVRKTGGGL